MSSGTLVVANLVPLAGVLMWQWSVSSVVVLYWFENVVIGVINVARMITFSPGDASLATVLGGRAAASISRAQEGLGSAAMKDGADLSPPHSAAAVHTLQSLNGSMIAHGLKLFVIPFFIVHYFMFCAGHGVFVFSLFSDEDSFFADTSGMGFTGSLFRAIEIFSTPLAYAAAILAASHVLSFFVNYLGGGEYRRLNLQRLMMMPYGRIVVLHLTIIFGGFATLALGEPVWLVVILVLVKMAVDVRMHLKEHLVDA